MKLAKWLKRGKELPIVSACCRTAMIQLLTETPWVGYMGCSKCGKPCTIAPKTLADQAQKSHDPAEDQVNIAPKELIDKALKRIVERFPHLDGVAPEKKEYCGCACHDKKFMRGLEHETRCCKNMVGWMEGEEPPKTSKDPLPQSIEEKETWEDRFDAEFLNDDDGLFNAGKYDAEVVKGFIRSEIAATSDHTEHCFICHKEIELGSTASSIHTGCMALLTPNAEVEKEIAAAREEGKEEGMRVGTTATLKLDPQEISAWITKDAQAYREGYETALKEAIEEIEKTLESSSGGGNWRRNFIQLLSSLQSKLKN